MKKTILCFGDSNTYGYSVNITASGEPEFGRFTQGQRWTSLLQQGLGTQDFLVIEEGLNGRTTVFDDPLQEGLSGLTYLSPCLHSHKPIHLLLIMLGTNDTKERFSASPPAIALGLTRLVTKAKTLECWGGKPANILIIAPPPIEEGLYQSDVSQTMGAGCVEKSQALAKEYRGVAQNLGCHFFDAGTLAPVFNKVDFMHLTLEGNKKLAVALEVQVRQCLGDTTN